MLYSQGVPLEALGIARVPSPTENRATPSCIAERRLAHLRRALPSVPWHPVGILDESRVERRVRHRRPDSPARPPTRPTTASPSASPTTRSAHARCSTGSASRSSPRPIGALSDLAHHQRLAADGFAGRVIPTFRPDSVVDPDHERVRRARPAPRRDHRPRHQPVGRLPRRVVRPPETRHLTRRHRHRSRAPVGVHRVGRRRRPRSDCSMARWLERSTPPARRHSAGRCSSRWPR